MNKLGSIGSSVMVGRRVGVKVGRGVSVTIGVPVGGVVVGCGVLTTNKSGVYEAGNPKGVTVGPNVFTGVGVCRNGSDGNPLHPERREILTRIKMVFFIKHLIELEIAHLHLRQVQVSSPWSRLLNEGACVETSGSSQ